jgi:hypothetical protein
VVNLVGSKENPGIGKKKEGDLILRRKNGVLDSWNNFLKQKECLNEITGGGELP